jgi:hypothetical protein
MDEVKEEENEEDMAPSKPGNVWEPPLSPSTYDSNPETKNSILILPPINIIFRKYKCI